MNHLDYYFFLFISCFRVVCSFASTILCARIPGLSPAQRQLCVESPDAVVALGAGHLLGSQECQHQFKGHRWNCTQVWNKDVFGHVVIVGKFSLRHSYLSYGTIN